MFISIEGIDGCGKTTYAKMLCKALEEQGVDYIHTREPGGSPSAEKIRELFIHTELEPISDLLMMSASRMEHIHNTILPALAAGKVIVSERFIDSTYAYQIYGNMELVPTFMHLEGLVKKLVEPTRTLFLDVTLDTAVKRLDSNGLTKDKFEVGEDRLEKMRGRMLGYHVRMKEDAQRFKIIDAEKPLDVLRVEVEEIAKAIKNKKPF